jgi:hypothetical protein
MSEPEGDSQNQCISHLQPPLNKRMAAAEGKSSRTKRNAAVICRCVQVLSLLERLTVEGGISMKFNGYVAFCGTTPEIIHP